MNAEDIAAIVIDERNGVPVTVGDVAQVGPAPMIRAGLATRDGQGEIVTGLVMMLIGQNSRGVVERVKTEIEQLQKSMPAGVTMTFFLRPLKYSRPVSSFSAAASSTTTGSES